MARTFTGKEVASALMDMNYVPVDRTGSHLKLRWEAPEGTRSVLSRYRCAAKSRRVRSALSPSSGVEFNAVPQMFADGTLDPEPLISSRISLADIVDDGFEALLDPEREEVKILVEP